VGVSRSEDPKAWIATHRFAARVLTAAALIGLVVNSLGFIDLAIGLLLAAVLAVVLYARSTSRKPTSGQEEPA
jgi:uncharacterized membrane protein